MGIVRGVKNDCNTLLSGSPNVVDADAGTGLPCGPHPQTTPISPQDSSREGPAKSGDSSSLEKLTKGFGVVDDGVDAAVLSTMVLC